MYKNNGNYVHKKPLDFVLLRASIGLLRDVKFLQLLEQTAPIQIKGAWHYWYDDYPWQKQADNFIGAISGLPIHLIAWDYEKIGNVLTAATDADCLRALDYTEQKTGLPTFLYSNLGTIAEMHGRGAKWVLNKKLWCARWFEKNYYYQTATSPYHGNRPIWMSAEFFAAAKWQVWQYGGDKVPPNVTWTIPGKGQGKEYGVDSASIELDTYNGSADQMRLDLGVVDDAPPIESEPLTDRQRIERLENYVMEHGGF